MIPLDIIIAVNMIAARLYGAKKEPWWLNDPRVWAIADIGPKWGDRVHSPEALVPTLDEARKRA